MIRTAPTTVKVAAMGDCLARRRDAGAGSPFAPLLGAGLLEAADVRLLNLETVLTARTAGAAATWVALRTDPAAVKHLADAGIDAVSVAHNHILDYGVNGARETLAHLADANIPAVGVGDSEEAATAPAIFERNGLRIGLLALFAHDISNYTAGLHVANLGRHEPVVQRVARLAETCDVPIVSLHWGPENIFHPSPDQIAFARSLVDAGARLVFGHHSHCVQGVERYKQGLIAYSLGNFNFWMFDVRPDWRHRLSAVLDVDLSADGVVGHRLRPVWIDEQYRPVPLPQDGAAAITAGEHFDAISDDIVAGRIDWNGWYEQLGRPYVINTLRGLTATAMRHGQWLRIVRWLSMPHTQYAIRGLGRSLVRRRGPLHHPAPVAPSPIEIGGAA